MTSQTQSGTDDSRDESLLEEFLKDAALQGLTEETVRTYKSNLQNAFEFFDADPRSIDRHDPKDLLVHLRNERPAQDGTEGVSSSTVNNYFSALNSYFKLLKFEGYIHENVIPEFRERYLETARDGSD